MRETLGRLHYMLSQTPQVWLDFQMYETEDGGLALVWDTAEELFAEGLIDEMLNAYGRLLEWLAADAAHWECVPDVLPERQRERRGRERALALPAPEETMHGPFFARAAEAADTVAIIDGLSGERITYGELAGEALRTAALLRRRGVERGMPVAVTLPRGREQIVAVLGVLAAGGFYVPVSPSQPLARRERIHRKIGVRFVLSRTDVLDVASLPSGAELIDIAERHAVEPLADPAAVAPDDLAYVIFTSGSTGEPKGVAIEHRSARNTIADINGGSMWARVTHALPCPRSISTFPYTIFSGCSRPARPSSPSARRYAAAQGTGAGSLLEYGVHGLEHSAHPARHAAGGCRSARKQAPAASGHAFRGLDRA